MFDFERTVMNDVDYARWMVQDTCMGLLKAVVIYAVALGAYWLLVA